MLIREQDAPRFEMPGLRFTGLAAPSRGARETCVWRVTLDPGAPGRPHSMDREEVFHALDGRARMEVAGEVFELAAGDAFIVPADCEFSLSNPHAEPFEAVVVLPVGSLARMPDGSTLAPPWAQ